MPAHLPWVVSQVLEWVLSYDGVNQPEPLAITAAAAALLISGKWWLQ
jgi:polyribonucleotide nucleotidyltransferase